MKKYIFYAIFMASIIANIVFFLSDGILYLKYTTPFSGPNRISQAFMLKQLIDR